jgi:glycosyltransferase involved in cell wall biosynthesis
MAGVNMTAALEKPLVSAIIIFLNGERFIGEAIESILAQTMDRWELLLVDDGSTDRSTEIALQYKNGYPKKIKYLEHEGHRNLGMSASRNLGLGVAQGEYIAFLDADDVWLPQRLERHVEVFDKFPATVMVCSPTLYWYNWRPPADDWPAQADWIGRLFLPIDVLLFSTVSLRQFVETGNTPAICSLTARRETLLQVGGFESVFRGLYEDQVYIAKMCLAGPIVAIEEVLDQYRQHPDSCCYQAGVVGLDRAELQPGRDTFLYWLEQYLRKLNHSDQELWEELRFQLWPYKHPRIAQAMSLKRRVVRRIGPVIRKLLPEEVYQWLKLQDQRYFSGNRSR